MEDYKLLELYLHHGKKWALIAKLIGSKNEHSVKNRMKKIIGMVQSQNNNEEYKEECPQEIKESFKKLLRKLITPKKDKEILPYMVERLIFEPKVEPYLELREKPFFFFLNNKIAIELEKITCSCSATFHSNIEELTQCKNLKKGIDGLKTPFLNDSGESLEH